MNVDDVDILDSPQYRQVLDCRRSDLFHAPTWAHVLDDAYGLRVRAVVTDGCALPYCRIRDELGERIVSLPFSDFCDPLLDTAQQWRALVEPLAASGAPLTVRCLHHHMPADDSGARVVKTARWHGIDAQAADLWRRLAEPKRRAVSKARRSGVAVTRPGDEAFLDAFHAMHVAMRKQKYRLLAQPRRFFEAICRRFGESGAWHPLAATCGGQTIAAMVFLRWRDTLYYKFGTSRPEALSLRPNDLLMWRGIELARELGCQRLDLGLSDDDQPGLIRFKRQFGAEEKVIQYVRIGDAPADARAAALRPILGEVTRVLTEPAVPDDVTASAGALLYDLFA